MSELTTTSGRRARHAQLLATASVLAFLAPAYAQGNAQAAEEADSPTVWIELGGQLEHVDGQGDGFAVPFVAANPDFAVLQPVTPLQAQNPPPFSFAIDGKLSIQPTNSNWIFSATVNYGRSSNFKHDDHQILGTFVEGYKSGVPLSTQNIHNTDDFSDTQVHHRQSYTVLDFTAGRDFGLGMFGNSGSSVLNLGVRFAQFSFRKTVDVRARPDLQFKYFHPSFAPSETGKFPYFHTYHISGQATRNFHGVGPSLSWSASQPFMGNTQNGEVVFDWGLNAALLFGRQKTRVQHHKSGHYKSPGFSTSYTQVYQHSGGHSGTRSVAVPNVGGFAGLSFRVENFKVSAGYRADLFFGAIDGGIDTPKRENVGFYGPFAAISVGLGG